MLHFPSSFVFNPKKHPAYGRVREMARQVKSLARPAPFQASPDLQLKGVPYSFQWKSPFASRVQRGFQNSFANLTGLA